MPWRREQLPTPVFCFVQSTGRKESDTTEQLSTHTPIQNKSFVFYKIILFIYFAVLGLSCCSGFSLVAVSGGYSVVAVYELLIAVASLALEHRFKELRLQQLQLPGSRAQDQFTISCSSACGILPDQGFELVSPAILKFMGSQRVGH